jgi:WD40 repeat protein
VRSGKLVLRSYEQNGSHDCVSFSPNGKWLAAGGNSGNDQDGLITLFDVASRKVIQRVATPGITVIDLTFSPDSRTLSGGGLKGRVEHWKVPSGESMGALFTMARPQNPGPKNFYAIEHSPSEKILALGIGSYNRGALWGELLLVNGATGKELVSLRTCDIPADSCAFSPDGKMLAVACRDHGITLFRLKIARKATAE